MARSVTFSMAIDTANVSRGGGTEEGAQPGGQFRVHLARQSESIIGEHRTPESRESKWAWVDLDYRPHAYQVSPRWRESRQEIV